MQLRPIVALFGMHSIACDDATSLQARRATLAAMARSVWLGPGIAIVFVAAFWRALAIFADHGNGAGTGIIYLLAGIAAMLAGWSLCILAIWTLARFLPVVSRT